MTLTRSTLALCCAAALGACSMERDGVQVITAPAAASSIRFFNYAVAATNIVPNVNFYANDQKVTGVVSTTGVELTTGTASGSAANGALYVSLNPGPYTFTARNTATVDNGLAITTVPLTLENGKYYSYYMSGYYDAATKKSDVFVVEDAFPAAFDYSSAIIRYVNASPNAPALTLVARDTVSKAEFTVGNAVPYKTAGAFVPVPPGNYTLNLRNSTGATILVVTGASLPAGRVGTFTLWGDFTVGGTTATNRLRGGFTANR